MIYFLTFVNLVILGAVAYLFYSVRRSVDTSGVRQVDDYLHELEGSVGQLTEQFERTSTKISKDLLHKTTELQALIGECDAKLAQLSRLKLSGQLDLGQPAAASASAATAQLAPPTGVTTVPPAVAARRMSASELLASKPGPSQVSRNVRLEQPAAPPPRPGGMPPAAQPAAAASIERAPQAAESRASAGPSAAPSPIPSPVGVPAEAVAPSVAQPNDKYRLIFLLASEGMDTASIAKHTNLTRSEVEMLLDLRRQGKI